MSKRVEPTNYRCDGCRTVAIGSRVADFSSNLIRVMLPEHWKISAMPASNHVFLSFLCPKCAQKEKEQEQHA